MPRLWNTRAIARWIIQADDFQKQLLDRMVPQMLTKRNVRGGDGVQEVVTLDRNRNLPHHLLAAYVADAVLIT